MQGGPKKPHQTHAHNSVRSEPIFKILSLEDSLVNSQQNGYYASHHALHMSPVAILPCETLMPENKRLTINYNVWWDYQ